MACIVLGLVYTHCVTACLYVQLRYLTLHFKCTILPFPENVTSAIYTILQNTLGWCNDKIINACFSSRQQSSKQTDIINTHNVIDLPVQVSLYKVELATIMQVMCVYFMLQYKLTLSLPFLSLTVFLLVVSLG